MKTKTERAKKIAQPRYYRGIDIPMSVIRAYVRQIGERFKPDKVILFGSRAYGQPHEDSDVDLLVVMPCPNELTQAARICFALEAPFPLDLIVRTPENLQWRIEVEDWFLREITSKGKVLYEAPDARVATKSTGRPARRKTTRRRRTATS